MVPRIPTIDILRRHDQITNIIIIIIITLIIISFDIILFYRYTVLGVMILTLIAGTVFWKFAPKEDQTVWRSTVSLALAMMFLMWAFTYLCQLHPLVTPRRSDLRPEYAE